jgi:hypothetical protein
MEAEMVTGAELNAENVVKVMLRSQPELVMRQKEADEKKTKTSKRSVPEPNLGRF